MVISEAMAAGTTPVASRISGVKQQIDDGTTGRMVDPGDAGELASALIDLLENPEKRRAMSEQSQERAREFSWESVTDQYTSVYELLQ